MTEGPAVLGGGDCRVILDYHCTDLRHEIHTCFNVEY